MGEPFLDEIVIFGAVPYGDDDVVVRLFGRRAGRASAFARAAKRSKKRFPSGLSALGIGQATLRPRRGAELYALESFEPEPRAFGLADDPARFGRAAYLAEITERLVPEEDAVPALFDTLVEALAILARGEGSARLLRAYELRLLEETGYLPELSPLGEAPFLDGRTGELVSREGAGTVPFSSRAQAAGRALLTSPLGRLPAVDDELLREVARLFASHLRIMGVRDLKSVAFLRSL